MMTRRFLIAPALARLIRCRCGSFGVVEGFFSESSDRIAYLRIGESEAHLILSVRRCGMDPDETLTGIPAGHASALLSTCPGKISFEQSSVTMADGCEVTVRSFNGLHPFATANVTLPDRESANAFAAPVWFGADVTDDDSYANRGLALGGIPRLGDVAVADAALDALMDVLDRCATSGAAQGDIAGEAPEQTELPAEPLRGLAEEAEQAIDEDPYRGVRHREAVC